MTWDYQDLEAGTGECFGRCREDVVECYTQCRTWNKLSSALGILLLVLLGILYTLGIIVAIPVVVSGIIVMYTFYNVGGILFHVCQAMRDLCNGGTQDCWTRCSYGIDSRLIRSEDDVKGFFTRCKNGIQETFPCKGCGYILVVVHPLIVVLTLSIIYILSTLCASVITTTCFVIFCLVFSATVVVASFLIVAAIANGASTVLEICIIIITCMLIVSSVYIVFAMLFAGVCSFCSEEVRNKYGIFAVTTYYKYWKNSIDKFLTLNLTCTAKYFGFPGCSNFLSAVKSIILYCVLCVTVLVGVATLIAEVVLCFPIYLIGRCIAACCCKE